MWLVRVALRRPYIFVIISLLILISGIASIVTTPTDILPEIDIPIVSVIWTYNGLDADDMSLHILRQPQVHHAGRGSLDYLL